MIITSLQNPKIKQAVRLRDKRGRQRAGLMLVEGFAELSLALASGVRPQTLFFCPAFTVPSDLDLLLVQARARDADIVAVSAPVFEKISYRDNPDGWLALCPLPSHSLTDLRLSALTLLLVAEAVEKPGNLGAMLRSADAAGADGMLVCDPHTDVDNPNVVRSSRGALFSVPVAQTTNADALAWLRAREIAVVAATPQAETLYTDVNLSRPVAIAVGTEKEGLSRFWLEQADAAVRIPMRGQVNSLNVATATTLLLYEALRQRTTPQ